MWVNCFGELRRRTAPEPDFRAASQRKVTQNFRISKINSNFAADFNRTTYFSK